MPMVQLEPLTSLAKESVRSAELRKGRTRISHGKAPQKRRTTVLWVWELLSLLLAAIAFAAIVITLAIYQGRPLPQWPHQISINTLIAIFTAVLKAALLVPVGEGITRLKWLWFRQPRKLGDLETFDSASRGPWGSFLLFLALHGRNLAALGAFITVLSIGIDPFSQQILQYYDCNVADVNAKATLPTSNFYLPGQYFSNGDTKIPDSSMSAALYLGLLYPPTNASANIKAQCSTGNCVFSSSNSASYSSIAMSSECSDISNLIQNVSYTDANNYTSLNYTLPSGAVIGPNAVVLSSMYVVDGSDDPSQDLVTIDTLMAQSPNIDASSYTPFATRCSLYPSVNSYAGNITNGVLQENFISSERMQFYGGGTFAYYYSLAAKQTFRDGSSVQCTPTSEPKSSTDLCSLLGYTPYNFSSTETVCYPNDCIWTLGVNPTGGIQARISELFSNQSVQNIDGIPNSPAPWLVGLWSNGTADLAHFQTTMKGLADTMTSVMRQQGDNSTASLVTGTTLGSQTCIRVQWPWLSFPAALLFLTVIFFISTVAQISSSPMRNVWTSPSLALLFHGLSTEVLFSGKADDVHDLEDEASKTIARLECLGEDFGFVEVGGKTGINP